MLRKTFNTERARLTQDFSFLRQARIFFRNETDFSFVLLNMNTVQIIYMTTQNKSSLNRTKYSQFFKEFLPKVTFFKH